MLQTCSSVSTYRSPTTNPDCPFTFPLPNPYTHSHLFAQTALRKLRADHQTELAAHEAALLERLRYAIDTPPACGGGSDPNNSEYIQSTIL